jgi:hypothetical protein
MEERHWLYQLFRLPRSHCQKLFQLFYMPYNRPTPRIGPPLHGKRIRSEKKHPFWRKASVIEFWNCLLNVQKSIAKITGESASHGWLDYVEDNCRISLSWLTWLCSSAVRNLIFLQFFVY